MATTKPRLDSASAVEKNRQFAASGRLGMARRWTPDDEPAQLAAEAEMLRANAARLTLEAAEKLEHAARLDIKAQEMRAAIETAQAEVDRQAEREAVAAVRAAFREGRGKAS